MISLAQLSENDRKEQLSVAYAWAIASKAGFAIASYNLDRNSVDLTFSAAGKKCPSVCVQLKATSHPKWVNGDTELAFTLSQKNYHDLRRDRVNPIYLVVLELPDAEPEWLEVNDNGLLLRRCAWWMSLANLPESTSNTVTVRIPKSQTFTPDALMALMQQADE
jgi:hypothetical protein